MDKRAYTSKLIVRQTCLRGAVDLHGPGTELAVVLNTADKMVDWVNAK